MVIFLQLVNGLQYSTNKMAMDRKIVRTKISKRLMFEEYDLLLKHVLNSCIPVHVEFVWISDEFNIVLYNENLPEVKENEDIPMVVFVITKDENGQIASCKMDYV